MTLLLTGSTGFVGRNLLLRVLRDGSFQRIVLPVRDEAKLRRQLAADGFPSLPKGVEVRPSYPAAWEKRVRCDVVVHAAAVLFGRSWEEYERVNIEGTRALLSAVSGKPRVILISSQSAGGPTPRGTTFRDEKTADAPISDYGRSKRDMERMVFREFPNANVLALRPPMVLGARDLATLPLFAMAASRIRVKPGWAHKTYSWIAVEDLIDAILATLRPDPPESRRRVFYVANPNSITDSELISAAVRASAGPRGMVLRLPQTVLRIAAKVVDAVPSLRSSVPSLTRDRAVELFRDRWVVSGDAFSAAFAFTPTRTLDSALESWVAQRRSTESL